MSASDSQFSTEDADQLQRVSEAIFGTWRENGPESPNVRVPGIVERLERLEVLLRRGVAAAAGVGALIGSLLTAAVDHLFTR